MFIKFDKVYNILEIVFNFYKLDYIFKKFI